MNASLNYLKCLPVRRRPAFMESLPSYLHNIALDNGLPSLDHISKLLFPHADRRTVRQLSVLGSERRYIPYLCQALNLEKRQFRRLTFQPIVRKFGRSIRPQAISNFMTGIYVHHRRWCPLCLAEDGYYQLLWQISPIVGCIKHQVYLHSKCPNCLRPVSQFAWGDKINVCPYCGGDFHECTMQHMPINEVNKAHHLQRQYNFLVAPNQWENHAQLVIKFVGQAFRIERYKQNRSMQDIIATASITINAVTGIERGNFELKGAKLSHYLTLAQALDINLIDLFKSAELSIQEQKPLMTLAQIQYIAYEYKVKQAVQKLIQHGKSVSYRAVAAEAPISTSTIQKHHSLMSIIKRAKQDQINEQSQHP